MNELDPETADLLLAECNALIIMVQHTLEMYGQAMEQASANMARARLTEATRELQEQKRGFQRIKSLWPGGGRALRKLEEGIEKEGAMLVNAGEWVELIHGSGSIFNFGYRSRYQKHVVTNRRLAFEADRSFGEGIQLIEKMTGLKVHIPM